MAVKKKSPHFLRTVKNWFFTGLFILLPLGITAIVVGLLLDHLGAPVSRFFLESFGLEIPDKFWMTTTVNLFSTLFVVLVITALGYFSRYFLGRAVIHLTERIIDGVPFVNTIYKTVKQVVETFNKNRETLFQTTVLIEFPHKGMYAIGFLTSDGQGEVQVKTKEHVVGVFMPTTPNPTSGFLLLVPREDIVFLDMSVADGMKMIVSGGVVSPEYLPREERESQKSEEEKPREKIMHPQGGKRPRDVQQNWRRRKGRNLEK
ncbi:MAG: DUF502 domain-containing protein [Puniceicoccales bacterium]|jgi:uncharacterized membrane protein|nr:DUF502 domain-containing protein [Puniceicoccales bacterium]